MTKKAKSTDKTKWIMDFQDGDIRSGAGYGYKDDDGKVCMINCFKCGRENYIMAVSSGQCAWCGYDARSEEDKK